MIEMTLIHRARITLEQVPEQIQSMPYIKHLDLSNLRLSGTLLQGLYHHTSLSTMNIAENPSLRVSMPLFVVGDQTQSISITVTNTVPTSCITTVLSEL